MAPNPVNVASTTSHQPLSHRHRVIEFPQRCRIELTDRRRDQRTQTSMGSKGLGDRITGGRNLADAMHELEQSPRLPEHIFDSGCGGEGSNARLRESYPVNPR
ncbi:MAG: hypothetical protein AB7L13_04620 [Acidimicrobiia bacterium]